MAFKYQTFFCGWGSDVGSRFLLFMFWTILILEVPLYIINAFYLMKWFFGFRPCWAFTATWIHFIGLLFACSWVPYAFLLSDFEKEGKIHRRYAYMFYLIGVIATLALAPYSLWIISKYWRDDSLIKTEWMTATEEAFQRGEFPRWLTDLGLPSFLNLVDCCAWHGPFDLGVTYNFSMLGGGKKLTMERMDDISGCYNYLFKTTMKDSLLSFSLKNEMEALPQGCSTQIGKDLRDLSYLIFFSSIIQIILTVLQFLGYSYYPVYFFKQIRDDSVTVSFGESDMRRSRRIHPSESDSLDDIKGPKTSPTYNNNSSPRSLSPSAIVINKRDRLNSF